MVKNGKELLTNAKAMELLKVKHNEDVVYYNFDAKCWNTAHYLGHDILWRDSDTLAVQDFKKLFESEPEFADVELVACAIKAIAKGRYWYKGMPVPGPVYSQKANAATFNVIRRDRQSGRLLPVSDAWIAGVVYANQWMLTQFAMNDFINYKDYVHSIRNALVAEYGRKK